MQTKLLSFLLLFLTSFSSIYATHIVGGELRLEHVRNNTYNINLNLYFDEVNGSPILIEDRVLVESFDKRTNTFITSYILPMAVNEMVEYENPTCEIAELAVRRLFYSLEIELDPDDYTDIEGYYMSWQLCCRNRTITNIVDPLAAGQAFYTEFPPLTRAGTRFINSSPTLQIPVNTYACVNQPFTFDMSATDVDGDSVAYRLSTPLNGFAGTLGGSWGRPAPYPLIDWETGYSLAQVIQGSPPLNINQDGVLQVTSSEIGLFAFAITYEEYRDDELIGVVTRDYQMLVIDCPKTGTPVATPLMPDGSGVYNQKDTIEFKLSDVNKCVDIDVTDTELGFLTGQMITVGGFVGGTLPVSTGEIRRLGDVVRMRACFPNAPSYSQPNCVYEMQVIIQDQNCPIPLRDTVNLFVKVTEETASPQITTSLPDFLRTSQTYFTTITEENNLNFQVIGNDADGNLLDLNLISASVNPAGLGMNFLGIQGAPTLTDNFSWDVPCGTVPFGQDSLIIDLRLTATEIPPAGTVPDYFRCGGAQSDTITVRIFVQKRTPPVFDAGAFQLCPSSTTTLSVSRAYTAFRWQDSEGNIIGNSRTVDINKTGFYSVTVQNAGGCEELGWATVTALPVPEFEFPSNYTFCKGSSILLKSPESPNFTRYEWFQEGGRKLADGTTWTTGLGGKFYLQITNDLGCAAADTFFISVTPAPLLAIDGNLAICEGTSETTLTAIGKIQNPFHSADTLAYEWRKGTILVGTNAEITIDELGTYTAKVTNSNTGCFTELPVTIEEMELLKSGLQDTTFCEGDSMAILVGADLTHPRKTLYEWRDISFHKTLADKRVIIGKQGVLKVNQEGIYEVTIIDSLTRCSIKDTARVKFNPVPFFDIIGYDGARCELGDTLRVNKTNLAKYLIKWRTPNGKIIGRADTLEAIISKTGLYEVTITDTTTNMNCSFTSAIDVKIHQSPVVNLKDTTVCGYDSIPAVLVGSDFTHSKSTLYEWRNISFYQSRAAKDSIIGKNGTFNTFQEGTYEVTITDTVTQCSVKDTAQVTFNPIPSFNIIGYDGTRCDRPDTLRLDKTNLGNYKIKWETSKGNIIGKTDTLQVVVSKTGWYKVTATDTTQSTACSFTSAIYVTIHQSPTVILSDTTICKTDSLAKLIPTDLAHGETILYRWARAATPDSIVSTDPILSLDSSGTFIIFIEDSLTGCIASDTATITINHVPKLEILGADSALCSRTDTLFLANTNYSNMPIQWQGEGIVGRSDSLAIVVSKTGFYRVTVTDTTVHNQCAISDSIWVEINPNPEIQIPKDTVLCSRQLFEVSAFLPSHAFDAKYEWKRLFTEKEEVYDSAVLVVDFDSLQTYDPIYYQIIVRHPSTGCWSRDTLKMQFERNVGSKIITPTTRVCQFDNLEFKSEQAGKWAWRQIGKEWILGDSSRIFNVPFDSLGIYEVRLWVTNDNRCGFAEDLIRIRTLKAPVANLPEQLKACEDTEIELDVLLPEHRPSTTYEWKILLDENDTLLPKSSFITVTYALLSDYDIYLAPEQGLNLELSVRDTLTGCATQDTVSLTFERFSQAKVIEKNHEICLDESANLRGRNGARYYQWRTRTYPDSVLSTTRSYRFIPEFEGTFFIQLHTFNDSMCPPTISEAKIIVHPLPPIRAHETDTVQICLGETTILKPSDTTAIWKHNNSAGFISVSPKGSTLYEITATNQYGCQQTDGVFVNVNPNPQVPDLADVEYICTGDFRRIEVPENYARYLWTKDGTFQGDSAFLNVSDTGNYIVQVTNWAGCMTERQFEVLEIKANPTVEITGDSTVCADGLGATLETEVGFSFYRWGTPNDSLGISGSNDFQTEELGRFWVEVTDEFGCRAIDSITVTDCCHGRVLGMPAQHPIAISPSALLLENKSIPFDFEDVTEIHIIIFNRVGNPVFEEKRLRENVNFAEPIRWDGTFKGKLQPQGVYHATVHYTDCKNGQRTFVQSIMLMDVR